MKIAATADEFVAACDEALALSRNPEGGWLAEADAAAPMGHINRPDDLAEMVVFLLSERSGVVTGSVIDWDQTVQGGQG